MAAEAETLEERENSVGPVAELLISDDDARRIEGAGRLKQLAADPRCVGSALWTLKPEQKHNGSAYGSPPSRPPTDPPIRITHSTYRYEVRRTLHLLPSLISHTHTMHCTRTHSLL
jgi:hypothetical protein